MVNPWHVMLRATVRSKKITFQKKVREMNDINAWTPTKAQISVPLNHPLSYCSIGNLTGFG